VTVGLISEPWAKQELLQWIKWLDSGYFQIRAELQGLGTEVRPAEFRGIKVGPRGWNQLQNWCNTISNVLVQKIRDLIRVAEAGENFFEHTHKSKKILEDARGFNQLPPNSHGCTAPKAPHRRKTGLQIKSFDYHYSILCHSQLLLSQKIIFHHNNFDDDDNNKNLLCVCDILIKAISLRGRIQEFRKGGTSLIFVSLSKGVARKFTLGVSI